jgi:hypothetical protein
MPRYCKSTKILFSNSTFFPGKKTGYAFTNRKKGAIMYGTKSEKL